MFGVARTRLVDVQPVRYALTTSICAGTPERRLRARHGIGPTIRQGGNTHNERQRTGSATSSGRGVAGEVGVAGAVGVALLPSPVAWLAVARAIRLPSVPYLAVRKLQGCMVFLLMHRARRYDQAQARQAQRRAQKRLARTNGSFRGDGRPTTRHFGTSTLHAPGLLATFQLSDPQWVAPIWSCDRHDFELR